MKKKENKKKIYWIVTLWSITSIGLAAEVGSLPSGMSVWLVQRCCHVVQAVYPPFVTASAWQTAVALPIAKEEETIDEDQQTSDASDDQYHDASNPAYDDGNNEDDTENDD